MYIHICPHYAYTCIYTFIYTYMYTYAYTHACVYLLHVGNPDRLCTDTLVFYISLLFCLFFCCYHTAHSEKKYTCTHTHMPTPHFHVSMYAYIHTYTHTNAYSVHV